MIDNRPKVRRHKYIPPSARAAAQPAPIVERMEPEPVVSAPPPEPARERAAKVHTKGFGGLLGNLTGGLGNLGGGLLGGLGGGGLGGILPLLFIVGALGNGQLLPGIAQAKPAPGRQPNAVPAPPPLPAVPEPEPIKPHTGRKPRRSLRFEQALPPPEPATVEEVPPPPPPAPPPRPAIRPAEIKNLLGDLAAYLPGNGGSSATKISRIIGIADELRSLGGEETDLFATSAPADPMNRHIGLLNALSRNLPMSGASSLGRASQVLSMVNTLRSGGQGLGGLGGLGGLSGMANMLGSAIKPQTQAATEMKNITPQQADGIKDTVNRLLSGMDDKQKNDLLDKAKDFLGKK